MYNIGMDKINVAIIGGGASGLFLATALSAGEKIVIFERGERLGRKLSATGNGQGNITNLLASETEYFSSEKASALFAREIIRANDQNALREYFEGLGVLLTADERGRVYPAGRQASALTDALRFFLAERGADIRLSSQVTGLERVKDGFILTVKTGEEKREEKVFASRVVLCAGGKAAKNFGTDGSAYALAQKFGHSVTPLYPSLVQLKTDVVHTKTLKGIRVNDGGLTAILPTGEKISLRGDIIFTDYGVSGDSVFRISAFIADKISAGVRLSIDFLPETSEEEILALLRKKRAAFPSLAEGELLLGVLNNQVGRAVMKRAGGDLQRAAALVKNFDLSVTGSLGFDYAQVTKGGIPLSETDENLQSRFVKGLYFAGEILDVDGQCGGFNLQWAYSSAKRVAEALME
jgi:predicted Rossmann fold flavoprotein